VKCSPAVGARRTRVPGVDGLVAIEIVGEGPTVFSRRMYGGSGPALAPQEGLEGLAGLELDDPFRSSILSRTRTLAPPSKPASSRLDALCRPQESLPPGR